jgi:amino acid transporter
MSMDAHQTPQNTWAEPGDPAARDTGERLRGSMGTAGITLSVIGYLAPLSAMVGYVTLVIGYGNGAGAPVTFLVTGVLLALFAVGYMALVRNVPRPGAFYAYIAASLGRRVGLGASGVSLTLYLLSMVSIWTFGGLVVKPLIADSTGINLPWYVYSVVFLLLIGFLSYRGIDLNIRLLAVVVSAEVLVIVIFNVATLLRGGPDGYALHSFTWDAFTAHGSIAVGMLYAICTVGGFEATAVFREEARDPNRSIPRATYLIVLGTAVFYALSAWCLIVALGTSDAVSASASDPAQAFTAAFAGIFGDAARNLIIVLTVTSVLASGLSITNVATRYAYSLGVDGVLPRSLGVVHPRHGSPHRALGWASIIAAAGIAMVVLMGLSPVEAYSVFSGVGILGFEVLLFLVSVAVLVYFRGNSDHHESAWTTKVAPVLSVLTFAVLIGYTASHLELLTGKATPLTPVVVILFCAAFVTGVVYASWTAKYRPEVFARIGRALG